MIDVKTVLARLARVESSETPVISVYLNTEWTEEHQRERVRVFLKSRLREARQAGAADPGDVDWVEAQGQAILNRVKFEDANGVALFACQRAGLREVFPLRVAFADTFTIERRPFLRPLARAVEETPPTLVVFIDGATGRLVPLNATGTEEEVVLQSQVEGRHSMGGWAALAQARYQRHIREHREQHLEAVAAAVTGWMEREGGQRIVLAGEPRTAAALRRHLPEHVAARIIGTVAAGRWEPANVLAARAAELVALEAGSRETAEVDSALTEAAGGGAAVAGVGPTLEAVNRGAVRHLYMLEAFRRPGAVCVACETLQDRFHFACVFCGKETRALELGEAMVERVLSAGGGVTTVERHTELARRGGVAARVRYVEALGKTFQG